MDERKPYMVATGDTCESLQNYVNELIPLGYLPIGGVASGRSTEGAQEYCQAMISNIFVQGFKLEITDQEQ